MVFQGRTPWDTIFFGGFLPVELAKPGFKISGQGAQGYYLRRLLKDGTGKRRIQYRTEEHSAVPSLLRRPIYGSAKP
jgi:hypothetical protein